MLASRMRMTASGAPSTPQYYLTFNASTTKVACGSDASLDNLHDAAMTLEAWVRADGSWGEAGYGVISGKWNGTAGWVFYANNAQMTVEVWCATSLGKSVSSNASLTDATWHHVAFTWNDATAGTPSIWIDGTLDNGGGTINRNGAIKTDAALNLHHGSTSAGASTWDGDIAWIRLSNNIRYSATIHARRKRRTAGHRRKHRRAVEPKRRQRSNSSRRGKQLKQRDHNRWRMGSIIIT